MRARALYRRPGRTEARAALESDRLGYTPALGLAELREALNALNVQTDSQGAVHEVHQGDGGEQGEPLMPALYALGSTTAWHSGPGVCTPKTSWWHS